MRCLLMLPLLILVSFQNPTPRQTSSGAVSGPASQSITQERGSEQPPLTVKTLSAENLQNGPQPNGDKKPSNSWNLSDRIAVIASIVAFLQFVALVWTVLIVKSDGRQQMRAYLTVVIGDATFQVRANNLKFDAKPKLVNSGHTPARKVSYRIGADVLPVPIPKDFGFPLPQEDKGESYMGPGQEATMFAIVDDYIDEVDVPNVKHAQGRALYVWGVVTYKDVFGKNHRTNFCQAIIWLDNEKVFGFYTPGQNYGD